jgi:hypothetical protein
MWLFYVLFISSLLYMFRTIIIGLHWTIFKTSCSGIHGIPPFFSFCRDRIGFLVNSVCSVKCMSVSKPLALISPLVFRCSSPTTSLKNRKKKSCLIYSYVNFGYIWITIPHIEIQQRQPTIESDLKIERLRRWRFADLGWTQSSSKVMWRFEVSWLLYVTQKVPDSGHWLCFRILYWSQVKQLLFLCAVLNDWFFFF